MVEIELRFKGIIRLTIVCVLIGMGIGHLMYGRWQQILLWPMFWLGSMPVPIGLLLIPIGVVTAYLVLS